MAQTVAYFTGFETGDASELSAAGSGVVQSSIVRSGGYALQVAGLANPIAGLSATQISIRAYVYPLTTGNVTFYRLLAGSTPLLSVGLATTNVAFVVDGGSLGLTTTVGTSNIPLSQWTRIGCAIDLYAGGVVKVWVNGVLDINTTHTNDVTATPITVFNVASAASPNFYYFDDMRVDVGGVAEIGPGRCIARQGKAGTPTYNAWTKNGLATAALCWSETPFNATNNCSDNVLSDAQTMLVQAFSADPARIVEGTSFIAAIDTVNACKVGMIAKTAVAGNIGIRRRVGGVDTDVTVALTTSDAYHDSGIFTDTAANLDGYEIGVVNDLVGTIETVEDMWMMVDYTENPMPQAIL